MHLAIVNYIRESIAELQQVSWPARMQVVRYTLTIIVAVAVSMLIIAVVDYALSLVVDAYIIK